MVKINFNDFEDKNVVSIYERNLYLDKSQFEGLPTGKIKLDGVKISKVDTKSESINFDNVKYYEFSGRDVAQIEAIEAVKGLATALKSQMIANVPRVYFRILVNDKLTDKALAKSNFDFITEYSLDVNAKDKVLNGLKFEVTWKFSDQYHDVLGLVVPDLTGVKVEK